MAQWYRGSQLHRWGAALISAKPAHFSARHLS